MGLLPQSAIAGVTTKGNEGFPPLSASAAMPDNQI